MTSLQDKYFSLPLSSFILREKSYYITVAYALGPNDPIRYTGKSAARGAVTRVRASKYCLNDFIKLSNAERVFYATKLEGIRNKHCSLFHIEYSRKCATKFSRKRFLLLNGDSFPRGYYLNEAFEFVDKEAPIDSLGELLIL